MIARLVLVSSLLLTVPWALGATPPPTPTELVTQAQQQGLAQSSQWHALLHYRPRVVGIGRESQADDPSFFLAAQGKQDPAAELEATLAAFLAEPGPNHAQCRFPARFHWLQQQGATYDRIPAVDCPELTQWLAELNTEQVTLVFASSYLNSPSSMFGHTFLRLDPPDLDRNNPMLASTISYAADAGDQDSELMFAYRGIFGGYPGITTVEPYYTKVKVYSHLENRDLWEYQLNLSQAEVLQLLRHAWEIKDKRFDYYFFDENCAYRLLALIDVARPSVDLVDQVSTLRAIPSDTVRLVVGNNLVEQVHYRPSQATTLNHQLSLLSKPERQLVASVFNQRALPSEKQWSALPAPRQAAVLDASYELVRYRSLSDNLPRESTAPLSYQLLKERSRLAAVTAASRPEPPVVRDDQGHPTARASLMGGRYHDRNFLSLALRPAYHDLNDPAPGYREGSMLQFLNGELRYYFDDDELQLEQLKLVEILSLSPRNQFFQPISWGAGFGADRQLLNDGSRPLTPYVAGRGGLSYELAGGIFYSLATASLRLSPHLPDGFLAAPGGSLGWTHQTAASAWSLDFSSRFHPAQDEDPHHRLSASVDLHWLPSGSLTLALARENSGDLYATLVQAGIRWHF